MQLWAHFASINASGHFPMLYCHQVYTLRPDQQNIDVEAANIARFVISVGFGMQLLDFCLRGRGRPSAPDSSLLICIEALMLADNGISTHYGAILWDGYFDHHLKGPEHTAGSGKLKLSSDHPPEIADFMFDSGWTWLDHLATGYPAMSTRPEKILNQVRQQTLNLNLFSSFVTSRRRTALGCIVSRRSLTISCQRSVLN